MTKPRKYSDEQIIILKKYYPTGEWDKILPYFPETSVLNISATARRYGLTQNKKPLKADKDITGQRFGKLTAIQIAEYKKRVPSWLCMCDCGKETVVSVYHLLDGSAKSCGCLKHEQAANAIDLTGQKFGLLTAVERIRNYQGKGQTYYRCECECGRKDVFVSTGNLKQGNVVSCGTHNHKRIECQLLKNLDDSNRTYSVYRHIAPNGKSYIGITKQETEKRFQDGIGYKTQKLFWRAIKKYGWDNFQHEILEKGLTEKEASEKEIQYIEKYNSFAPNGYNVAEGGIRARKTVKPVVQYYNGTPVNVFMSTRAAVKTLGIAETTIKSHNDADHAVGGYYFEQLPPMHTYEIPEDYLIENDENHYDLKDIVAQELRQTTIKRNLSGGKPINKYTLSGEYICTYPSIAAAKASIESCPGEGISAAVNPNRQGENAYGYMWRYDTGDHSNIPPIKYKSQKAVQQIDLKTGEVIKEYKSLSEAARAIQSYPKQIAQVCRGKKESWYGYGWRLKP